MTATDDDGNRGSETITVLVEELDECLVELASEVYPSEPRAIAALSRDLRTVRESEYDDAADLPVARVGDVVVLGGDRIVPPATERFPGDA